MLATTSAVARRPRPSELLAPRLSPLMPDFEYSVHSATGSLRRDVMPVFPDIPDPSLPLLIVPILQRASVPLDVFGDAQAVEKDRLQLVFLGWARAVVTRLAENGHWADATEPATGAAFIGPPAALYSDVPPIARLLRYPTHDAGGCTILLHPLWKSAVYPATFFTTAPIDVLTGVLDSMQTWMPTSSNL
jgi:Methylmalonic aciduria and homocystinuria type D protein